MQQNYILLIKYSNYLSAVSSFLARHCAVASFRFRCTARAAAICLLRSPRCCHSRRCISGFPPDRDKFFPLAASRSRTFVRAVGPARFRSRFRCRDNRMQSVNERVFPKMRCMPVVITRLRRRLLCTFAPYRWRNCVRVAVFSLATRRFRNEEMETVNKCCEIVSFRSFQNRRGLPTAVKTFCSSFYAFVIVHYLADRDCRRHLAKIAFNCCNECNLIFG